jgi:hypothetical protein
MSSSRKVLDSAELRKNSDMMSKLLERKMGELSVTRFGLFLFLSLGYFVGKHLTVYGPSIYFQFVFVQHFYSKVISFKI